MANATSAQDMCRCNDWLVWELELDMSNYTLCRVELPVGCGYTYLVHRGGTSYTAFRTFKGVRRFLKDYGLTPKLVRREGKWAYFELLGDAETQYLWSIDELKALPGYESWRLENGQYTVHKVVRTPDKTVLYRLNLNVRDRPVTEYFYE